MTTTTYAAAEKELKNQGFTYELGMPLYGCRFKKGLEYAFVIRMGDNNYNTSYYGGN